MRTQEENKENQKNNVINHDDRRRFPRVETLGGWQCCNYPAADLCFETTINLSEGGASFLVPDISIKKPKINDVVQMNFIIMDTEFSIESKVVRLSEEIKDGTTYQRSHMMFIGMTEYTKRKLKDVIIKIQVLEDIELNVTGNIYDKNKRRYPFRLVSKNILLKE